MQFAKTAESAALLSEKSTAHLAQYVLFRVQRTANLLLPQGGQKYRASVCGRLTNYLRVLLPALLPDKKEADGCKFLCCRFRRHWCKSGPLPHFSDCVICVEHIYDHNLPITAVRDYDNLRTKGSHRCHCHILPDGRYRGAVRFFPDDPVWIFVLYCDYRNAENCFSAWLSTPKSFEDPTSTFSEKFVKIRYLCLIMTFPRCCKPIDTPSRRRLSPESKKARLNSEVISISSAFPVLPAQDSLYYELLALTAICGEVPCACADRLTSSKSYRKKVVTSLTHDKLLRIFSKDHLRGYRLGIRGKRLLRERAPERISVPICQAAPTPTPLSHPLPAVCGCIVSRTNLCHDAECRHDDLPR